MKRFYLLLAVLLPLTAMAAQFTRGPYVEDPTQTTLVLRFQTDEPTAAWLEYGPAPRCNQIMTLSPQSMKHKIVLYGLVPNQDYCYRVYVQNHDKTGVQDPAEGTFRTLFSPERKIVQFLALGDTGSAPLFDEAGNRLPDENAAARQRIATAMQKQPADFLIHTGNLTHSGLNEDANEALFEPFGPLLQSTPLFVALGPNEYGPDRAERESKAFLQTNYTRFHSMTWSKATPKYYSFDTANARFIFLDTNIADGAVWAPEIGEKSAQLEWLKTTLATAGEKWKIVVMHAPAYSSGAKGPNREVAANLVSLFEDYRVNLVLQGGDRNYERTFPMFRGETKPRGVTYITLGTAAATPTKRENPDPSTARFVSARHYAVGKIVDRKLTLHVYNDKGKELDKLELYL